MDIIVLLQQAVSNHASDIFVVAGLPVSYRANGRICREKEEKLMPPQTKECVEELYKLAGGRDIRVLEEKGDDDFSFAVPGLSRFRVSAYKQRGALSAVIRVITFELPEPNEIGIPDTVMSFYNLSKGLVLVTGPAGSGKSTTLACLVDKINHSMEKHIITLEDPIEYLHNHAKSVVNQREIGSDSTDYAQALRAALREDPDVILVGEMRDLETISTAITAAETGHLVFSTLHTIGADKTIDRIIDVFPPNQQQQIRIQLASVLECVVSQQLLKKADGSGRVAALEVLFANNAVRNLIRESKTYQIASIMQTNKRAGMQTMDDALYDLYMRKLIDADNAVTYAQDPVSMNKKVNFDF